MTEDSKQELTRLLHEAIASLEIRQRSANWSQLPALIDVDEYGSLLQQNWASRSLNLSSVVRIYEIHIANEATKSILLDFIREEFASYIHEDKIESASCLIGTSLGDGWPLDDLLEQLLKIAIVYGIERAVLDFDKCTQNRSGSFQYIAMLEGIKIDTEIQIFEGIRLVPLPNSTEEIPNYVPPDSAALNLSVDFLGKTLLISDCSVSPVFHKPCPDRFQKRSQSYPYYPFQIEMDSGEFPHSNLGVLYNKLPELLSLVCNSPVQISLTWNFMAGYELFNLNFRMGGEEYRPDVLQNSVLRHSIQIGQAQIVEAKRLYKDWGHLDPGTQKKLQIPIGRWIKSKTHQSPEDKIIDAVIAFEALYLPDSSESTFKLAVRASWYLGKDREDRKRLFAVFKELYKCRSKVVHGKELTKKNVTIDGETIPMSEFITRAQDLCLDSIKKIMKQCLQDRKFPKNDYWDSLILG